MRMTPSSPSNNMPPLAGDLPWPALQRARRTVVVVDMVESVRLMEANEEDTVRRWQHFVGEVATQVLPAQQGRLVKSLGDGLLCEFPDVASAVQSALDMQQLAAPLNKGRAAGEAIHMRIGAHTTDLIVDALDVYGSGVNLAARLATLAGPGEIVVSAEVRDGLTDGLDADFEDLGPCYLKHMQAPVRAYRVGAAGAAPVVTPAAMDDSVALLPSIAVIPFPLRAGTTADAMLGEAIADDITAGLAKSGRLRVTSRLSATAFRDRQANAREIGAVLRVGYVLSGAVSVSGQQLLVGIELTDAHSGEVLWVDSLRTSINDLFSGQGSLVSTVVAQTGTAILDAEIHRASTASMPSLASYTLLLGAVALMHRGASQHDFARASMLLGQLAERHRRSSAPHAWLAKWHLLNVVQGWSPDPLQDAQFALDSSQRALDQDERDPLALTIDGQVRGFLRKDLAMAESRHLEALAINPSEPMAWLHLANVRSWRGEGSFAEEATRKALELSPLDPMKPYFESIAAAACLSSGQYRRAVDFARRSLRGHRSHTATYRVLAISLIQLGEADAARQVVADMRKLEPALTVSRFRERYPGAAFPHAEVYARALAEAGLPA
jgi:adenylate cyclase